MKWLRRRPRLNLGRYVGPIETHEASIEEMVDDGVLIAAAATRLAVKNLVILKALRDRVDYSVERTMAAVRQELHNLAAEKDCDAQRLTAESERAAQRGGVAHGQNDYRRDDVISLQRRAKVSAELAARLRERSVDEEFVGELVRVAHAAAWDEIAASITARAAQTSGAPPDEAYERERGGRLLRLLGDLNDLEKHSQ